MPYKLIYFDAPKDLTIPVHKGIIPPDGFRNRIFPMLSLKLAYAKNNEEAYYCIYCEGWIIGFPNEYEENTLEPEHLAGRKGKTYHCIRCGKEIAFIGKVS